MQRALVIGGSGFVGRRLVAALGPRGLGTFRGRPQPGMIAFDATAERLRDRLPALPADLSHVFVPFGAIDMEGCAREPEATARVNVEAVTQVLQDALAAGLSPVFVSTDYVFDGTRALWTEDDVAVPRMAYGAQKLEVERRLAAMPGPWLVCRLSKVVSAAPEPQNMLADFGRAILAGSQLRLAHDQYFSPAAAEDLARAMVALADRGAHGLVHVAGPERFSRLELFELMLRELRAYLPEVGATAVPASLHDFGFLERRPLDTSLSTDRLQAIAPTKFRLMREICSELAAALASPAEVVSLLQAPVAFDRRRG